MTTALTILLIIMVIEMALVICLLLRRDDDGCNSRDRLPSYYHPKKPKPNKDDY